MARPKIKSHSGVSKRIRRTGSDKLVRRKAGRRHILTSKPRDRKRRLKRPAVVDRTMTWVINRLMPSN